MYELERAADYPGSSQGKAEHHPYCPYCGRFADEIDEVRSWAKLDGISPAEYAMDDGTYKEPTGEFACTPCYVKLGMPSSPSGWKAGDPVG